MHLARPTNQEDAVTPYTDADVDLVADAIVGARLQGHRDWTDRIARAVLDALVAADRLNTAIAHQFSVRYPGGVVDSMTPTITPQDAADLYDCADGTTTGPWTKVGAQFIRQSRWHDCYYLVVRNDAGEFWGLEYRDGLTEDQESIWPWEDDEGPLDLTRLYPHEVVKVEFRREPAEVTP